VRGLGSGGCNSWAWNGIQWSYVLIPTMPDVFDSDVANRTISICVKKVSIIPDLRGRAYRFTHLHEAMNRRLEAVLSLFFLDMSPGQTFVSEGCSELATALGIKLGDGRQTECPDKLLLENLGGVGLQAATGHKLVGLHTFNGRRACCRPCVPGCAPMMVRYHGVDSYWYHQLCPSSLCISVASYQPVRPVDNSLPH